MLFSSGRFDALVESVAQRISMRFPPVVANDPERTISQERIKEILGEIFAAALQSGNEYSIGLVGRAQIRGAFRRQLREVGYDEKFVDFVADKFIEHVSRRQA
jgi:hypothetical protein